MSADLLRRAAALMRERATRARREDSADAWTAIPALDPDNNGWVVAHDPSHADYDTTVAQVIYDYEGFVSRHIASWHPAVALAVANLLEAHAEAEVPDDYDPSTDLGLHLALDIARTYLNESA